MNSKQRRKLRRKQKLSEQKLNENQVPGITGLLNAYGDTSHSFTPANECPYFMPKSELCFLSGKICIYDTDTYRGCDTYAEGAEKRLPGLDGEVPTIPPASMHDLIGNEQNPVDVPMRPLFRS